MCGRLFLFVFVLHYAQAWQTVTVNLYPALTDFAQARPSRRPCQTRQQLNVEGGPWIVVQGCAVFIDEKRLPKHDRLSGPSVALNWIWSASPALRRIAPAGGVRGTRSTQACADV